MKNNNGEIPVLNNNAKRMQEMLEEIKDVESFDSAKDVEIVQNLASLITDQYLRKTRDPELKKLAKASMDKYNAWYFELTDLIDKINEKTAGLKPIIDSSSPV